MSESTLPDVQKFLADEKVLVVDPSYSFGQVMVSTVSLMGAKPENTFFSRSYAEASQIISTQKPKVILTEFFIEDRFGLSLVDIQSQFYDEATRIAVLVTHNSADSAVAEAAEEQIDAYFLKPFSAVSFRNRLGALIQQKMTPSEYVKKIREGKVLLLQHEFAKAVDHFRDAALFSDKPCLAFYYGGQANLMQKNFTQARVDFESGLAYEPLHYKCLTGQFDSLYQQGLYNEAYALVSKIRANFPISPKKFVDIISCAVFSNNFDDILSYYEVYKKLDSIPKQLNSIFSAALITAGKYHVMHNRSVQAEDCFTLGVRVRGHDINYLRTCIKELLKIQAVSSATAVLRLFPYDQVGGKEHAQLSFLVSQHYLSMDEVVTRGKKMIDGGFADEECYRTMVRLYVKMEKPMLAEGVAIKGSQQFPNLREELFSEIEKIR